MSDKEKSADLILKLYELRREEVMREARNWFFAFNPESFEDVVGAAQGEHSAYYRMVTSYWDMACAFVNHGVLDEEMFNDTNGEHVLVFAKIQPFVERIREATSPTYMQHLEKVVMRRPDAEKQLERMREFARRVTAERSGRAEADAANA